MRIPFSILFLFLLPSAALAQNWFTMSPDFFPEALMAREGVEMVNVYEVPKGDLGADQAGTVVRVVRSPHRSLEFDREGRVVLEIDYNSETGQVKRRAESAFGPPGIVEKVAKVYVTETAVRTSVADSANPGMRIAMEYLTEYAYDDLGRRLKKTTFERDGELSQMSERTFYAYAGGMLSQVESQYLEQGSTALSEYREVAAGEVRIDKKGGHYTVVVLDGEGRFSRIVEHYNGREEPSAAVEYFYRGEELDSSWARYGNPVGGGDAEERASRYFYDKGGKLVMTRTQMPDGSILETLHEYFYFRENE